MRFTVGRKLALITVIGAVVGLLVAALGVLGTQSLRSDVHAIDRANAGQKAVAEVDAAHDNVHTDVLQVINETLIGDDPAAKADAQKTLADDSQSLADVMKEAVGANVSPAITAEAKQLA